MKRIVCILTAIMLLFSVTFSVYAEGFSAAVALSEESKTPPDKPADGQTPPDMPDGQPVGNGQTPPEKPDGQPGGNGQTPPEKPDGQPVGNGQTPPEKPSGQPVGNGQTPPEMPNGQPGGMGGPGGGSAAPAEYAAVKMFDEDGELANGDLASNGTDESAVLVTSGNISVRDMNIDRTSQDSTGGDSASFYGVGAAVLATGGTLNVSDSAITTDAAGGTGVFAYGDAVVTVNNTAISTKKDTSGGIHVAGGGTLYVNDVTVTTQGNSSAAIRSDRGGGTMIVNGGSFTSNGNGSPAVYVTADITVSDAELSATGSEAVCIEGMNSLTLKDCALSGSMKDDSQNEVTWTVILYQSMSGDSQVGCSVFDMEGGSLTSANGGLFYTTNTESSFILNNVAITAAGDSEFFLRATGNSNRRGWGNSGANGADCTFTGIAQIMTGDIQWDSISTLDLNLTKGSVLTGAIVDDESCAGNGGSGWCKVTIDADSTWIVTGDSVITRLDNQGTILDADGNTVKMIGTDGSVLVDGTSPYTITVVGE